MKIILNKRVLNRNDFNAYTSKLYINKDDSLIMG